MSSSVADFVKDNAALWGLLALPLAAWAAAVATGQFLIARRAVIDKVRGSRQIDVFGSLLLEKVVKPATESLLETETPLQLQLRDAEASASETVDAVEGLSGSISSGSAIQVFGEAGSGKTVLSLRLSQHSVESRPSSPESAVIVPLRLASFAPPSPPFSRPARSEPDDAVTRWAVTQLRRIVPEFSRRFYRRALSEGMLILCLDGLDEVSKSEQKRCVKALTLAASSGLQLAVLSRPTATNDPTSGPLKIPGFRPKYLEPIQDAELENSIEFVKMLAKCDPAGPSFRTLRGALSNPLLLSIAILARAAYPDSVRGWAHARDPVREIWRTFTTASIEKISDTRRREDSVRAARWCGLLAVRGQSEFGPYRLGQTRLARVIPHVIASAVFLSYAFVAPGTSSGFETTIASILAGFFLIIAADAIWYPRSHSSTYTRRENRILKAVVTMVLVLFGIAVVLNFVIFIAFFAGHPLMLPVGVAMGSITITLIVLVVAFASQEPNRDYLTQYFLPARFRGSLWGHWIGFPVLALGFEFTNNFLIAIGYLALFPLVAEATGQIELAARGELSLLRTRKLFCSLEEIGWLNRSGRYYRFRHDELAVAVGREGALALAENEDVGLLPRAAALNACVDGAIDEETLCEADALSSVSTTAFPVDANSARLRIQFLFLGRNQPEEALAFCRSVRRTTRNALLPSEAELRDSVGEFEMGEDLWRRALDRASDTIDIYTYAKWVRSRIIRGDARTAIAHLQELRHTEDSSKLDWRSVQLALLQSVFGSSSEKTEAGIRLEAGSNSEFGWERWAACVELAQRFSFEGKYQEACEMLDQTRTDRGALLLSRRALYLACQDRREEAAAAARRSLLHFDWNADPVSQLETLNVIAAFGVGGGDVQSRLSKLQALHLGQAPLQPAFIYERAGLAIPMGTCDGRAPSQLRS